MSEGEAHHLRPFELVRLPGQRKLVRPPRPKCTTIPISTFLTSNSTLKDLKIHDQLALCPVALPTSKKTHLLDLEKMATKISNMHVSHATESDIPRLMSIQYAAFASEPVDAVLNGPNTPEYRELAGERLLWQMRNDPSLHTIKCVMAGQIVGFCMWHLYEKAREEAEWKKEHKMMTCSWIEPESKREKSRAYTLPVFETRQQIMQGRPHALLMYLCIDPQYQRQGAGGLLVGWGTKRADELGIPALLESSPFGYGLYRKCGFEDEGTVKINIDGAKITYPAMVRKAMRTD